MFIKGNEYRGINTQSGSDCRLYVLSLFQRPAVSRQKLDIQS